MLIKPSADLYDRIINRINQEAKLAALRKRLFFSCFGLIFSLVVFIPLVIKLSGDVSRSGLWQFFSLLFTDINFIAANTGDYLMTLLESTPVFSLAFTLAATLAIIFYIAKLEDIYIDFKKTKNNELAI